MSTTGRIGIIAAMEEELTILKSLVTNVSVTSGGGCEFTAGKLDGVPVVLLLSGIGKVGAAIATTLLIERFSPSYLINTGSAGATADNLSIGDVIVSTEVRHHDVDVTAFGYEYGQIPRMPAGYKAHERLVDIAKKVLARGPDRIHTGLIGSGDSFMSDPERIKIVQKHMPSMLAVEMEAAAIAQVAHRFDLPFLVIRSISDLANKESSTDFKENLKRAAANSAVVVADIVKEIEEAEKRAFDGFR